MFYLNMQQALKLHRSAIAPLTMVVAVVAKESWKIKAAKMAPFSGLSRDGSMQKSPKAINPLLNSLLPKDTAKPNIQYVKPAKNIQNPFPEEWYSLPPSTISTTFFIIMLTSFFIETQPDSNMPNPVMQEIHFQHLPFSTYLFAW